MEGQNYLGIYLSKDSAAVVCLGLQGREHNVLGCFSVSVEQPQDQNPQALVSLIAKGCTERELKFSDVAVAIDCSMFMQHSIHSEFTDPKQVASTIRFDTEEALATDISDVAIAFKIISSDQAGSNLAVFTTKQKLLLDSIIALQSNGMDPVTIEPDIGCLSRFILQNIPPQEDSHPLFALLSRQRGYLVVLSKSKTASVRTFLVSPSQDRNELLARQVPMTAAWVEGGQPVNAVKVFDSSGSVNYQGLNQRLGLEVTDIDLAAFAAKAPKGLADCADAVDFVIAYGAALSHLEKSQSINFRSDFMPYQGKKLRLEKTLKFIGISAALVMLALGLFLQTQLFKQNKPRVELRQKFEKDYSAVMLGAKIKSKENPVKKLEGELKRIESVKSGMSNITGEESVSAKLTRIFEAFNRCAAGTNLNIEKVSITDKSINITGDTSNRQNTLKFFEAIKQSGLEVSASHYEAKGERDNFSITVIPKK